MKVIISAVLFMLSLPLFCQEFPVEWGPPIKSSGYLIDILPKENSSFYTLRWSGLLGNYRIIEHYNMMEVNQERIKPVIESGIATIESTLYHGGKLIVFLSDKANGTMALYSQELGEDLLPSGPSVLLAEYVNANLGAKPNFNIISSANRRYIGVVWQIPGRKEVSDLYGYVILDSALTTTQKGEYTLPFSGNMSTINEDHISNTGDYYLILTEHKESNTRFLNKAYENFKAIHIYKIHDSVLKEFSVDVDEKRIDDIFISSNDSNIISLSGLYGNGNYQGLEGVFSIRIDANKDSMTARGLIPFGKDILKDNMTDRQFDRYERRFQNNGQSPQIYDYKLRTIFTLDDGSSIGSLEKYFIQTRTNYDSRTGISNTTNTYYYNDIIAFRIGLDGKFVWETRIAKQQVSVNDGGPYSSYQSFTNGKELHFIFNDNQRNYDELGEFSQFDGQIYSYNLSRRNNAVAICSINIETGKLERKTLFSRKELSSIVIPKMMKLNQKDKELLLYAITRGKERFGILSFKNKN